MGVVLRERDGYDSPKNMRTNVKGWDLQMMRNLNYELEVHEPKVHEPKVHERGVRNKKDMGLFLCIGKLIETLMQYLTKRAF